MIFLPNLCLIGGSSRHVGKTTLICKIINEYSRIYPITAFKATSIRPDDVALHGFHEEFDSDILVKKETDRSGRKDTSRMLLSGASEVYYLQAKDLFMDDAFRAFYSRIPCGNLIIGESIGLRKILNPGLFILMDSPELKEKKTAFREMMHLADKVIYLTDIPDDIAGWIGIENGNWVIR